VADLRPPEKFPVPPGTTRRRWKGKPVQFPGSMGPCTRESSRLTAIGERKNGAQHDGRWERGGSLRNFPEWSSVVEHRVGFPETDRARSLFRLLKQGK
jgi:hypothetical protein